MSKCPSLHFACIVFQKKQFILNQFFLYSEKKPELQCFQLLMDCSCKNLLFSYNISSRDNLSRLPNTSKTGIFRFHSSSHSSFVIFSVLLLPIFFLNATLFKRFPQFSSLICLVWLFIPCCFSCTVFTKRKFTISSLTASMLIVLICYQKGDLFTAHIFLSDSFI